MPNPFLKIDRVMLSDLTNRFSDRIRGAARSVWFYLLFYANYADNDKLKRGQIFVSRRLLAKETGVSEQTVRTVIDRLILEGFLAEKSNQQSNQQLTSKEASKVTNKGTILTIVNYDGWTQSQIETNQQKGQQSNQQLTSKTTTQEVSSTENTSMKQGQGMKEEKTNTINTTIKTAKQLSPRQQAIVSLVEQLEKMGMSPEDNAYSWIGRLYNQYGLTPCKEILDGELLKGTSIADFDGARNMRAYITKAIQNKANVPRSQQLINE